MVACKSSRRATVKKAGAREHKRKFSTNPLILQEKRQETHKKTKVRGTLQQRTSDSACLN